VCLTKFSKNPILSSIRNEPEFQKVARVIEVKYKAEHERVKKWLEKNQAL
jgi:hypothetical protein